jgi:cytolysin (calcineurin-like family phosphatase)
MMGHTAISVTESTNGLAQSSGAFSLPAVTSKKDRHTGVDQTL